MAFEIDRNSPLPLQRQLYLALKEWFVSEFSTDDVLPSELAISKQYGISQGTVRIALDNLVKEGLIARIPGRGSFLNPDFKIKLKKYNVGVILSEVDFFSNTIWEYVWINHLEIINGIVASNLPFNLSTEFISEDYFSEAGNDEYDGFILWPFLQKSLMNLIKKPCVHLEYKVDLRDGFRKVARDVVKRDHGKAGYIGFTSGGRIEELNKVFRESPLGALPEERVFECGGSAAEAYRSCMELISRHPDVDCLICSTDIRAQGALQYLKEQGIDVPGDVAVYGFDGTRDNRKTSPALTTCRFDWKFPGTFAVEQLRSLLDGGEVAAFHPTKGTLILQESTRH